MIHTDKYNYTDDKYFFIMFLLDGIKKIWNFPNQMNITQHLLTNFGQAWLGLA